MTAGIPIQSVFSRENKIPLNELVKNPNELGCRDRMGSQMNWGVKIN